MPRYKNETTQMISFNGVTVVPGQTIETDLYYDHATLGLTKISDIPCYNPVIISQKFSGDSGTEEVLIPLEVNGRKVENFSVDVYCSSGSAKIKYNTTSFDPVIMLYTGDGTKENCIGRLVDKIILEYLEVGTEVCITVKFI